MTRAARVVRRAAAAGLAVPAAVAGVSWHALAALVLAVLIVVVAVCWAIADGSRARRLALLIRACRGGASQPAAQSRAPARRQAASKNW